MFAQRIKRQIDGKEDRFKQYFLGQVEADRFLEILLPSLKFAFFSRTRVYDIATCIRNLSFINCKRINDVFSPMVFKYTERNDFNHFASLSMSLGLLEALLLQPSHTEGKYDTTNKIMDYCIEEFNIYDKVKFKNSLMIFNVVWSVIPTFHETWGREVVTTCTKMKYEEYLKKVEKEEPEEHAFWKLYERMETYAVTFFQKILSFVSYIEKPKSSTGGISESTSKIVDKMNTSLQFLIDGMNEKVFN